MDLWYLQMITFINEYTNSITTTIINKKKMKLNEEVISFFMKKHNDLQCLRACVGFQDGLREGRFFEGDGSKKGCCRLNEENMNAKTILSNYGMLLLFTKSKLEKGNVYSNALMLIQTNIIKTVGLINTLASIGI